MKKGTEDAFVEAQKSILNEVNLAIEELKKGLYENVYTRLTNLSDELTEDIRISTDATEETKKELNIATNETV
ncbi:MAG: hypothetical protein IJX99_06445 [Clostridia bacterium]|nr:hypothetical protein [Clostridia bacterium]